MEYDLFDQPNRVSDVNNLYMFTGRRYDTETGRTIVLKQKGVLAKYTDMRAEQIGLWLATDGTCESCVEACLDIYPNMPELFNFDPDMYDPYYDPFDPENWDF